jgi:hypothetical protein
MSEISQDPTPTPPPDLEPSPMTEELGQNEGIDA